MLGKKQYFKTETCCCRRCWWFCCCSWCCSCWISCFDHRNSKQKTKWYKINHADHKLLNMFVLEMHFNDYYHTTLIYTEKTYIACQCLTGHLCLIKTNNTSKQRPVVVVVVVVGSAVVVDVVVVGFATFNKK